MSKFKFDLVLDNFKRNEINVAKEIANAQKNYFVKSFDKQGWNSQQWKVPKRRIQGTDAYKYPKNKGLSRRSKKTLIGTGELRRKVAASIKSVTSRGIKFVVDSEYAAIHNEGLKMRGTWRKMPKRQFMGFNRELNGINKAIIQKWMRRNFNK